MPLDGLWIARFTAAELFGSGVVVFINGKIFGGETGFYYIGTYEMEGAILKARVMIRHFDRSVPSGFGIEGDYEMDVSARFEGEELKGTAVVVNRPQYSLGIRLTKRANL
jgi:hypothetical protein